MEGNDKRIFYNARIYVSGRPDHSWMIIDPSTGYVVNIGTENPPLTEFNEDCRIDCGGCRILPGLHESHIHVSSIGQALDDVQLQECESVEELQKRVGEYYKRRQGKKWIVGRGWDQDLMGRWPTKEDIDAVCPDKPAILMRNCEHVCVLNSKAMEIVGFDKTTADPQGGSLDRYPTDHSRHPELTGVIRETAIDVVLKHVTPSSDEKMKYIRVAIRKLLEYGVTSAHALEDCYWNEYCQIADKGDLPIRIFLSAYFEGRCSDNFPRFANETRGDFLSCDRIKLFADGSLGGATAAMSLPYKNTNNKGILIYTQDTLNNLVQEATSLGYRLEIHVIGDAGAEATLDAIEYARMSPEKRPLMTHSQFLRDDLIDRMKRLGCVANIQPQFVVTDAVLAEETVATELLPWSYAWKTLTDRGVVCSGGSDAPVESPQPMIGIYDAIFRPRGKRDHNNLQQFRPEECLSVQEAIDLYTKNGAYATLQEHRLGQLLPGYQADFIFIQSERDVVDFPEEFLTAKVSETWVAGKRRF